MVKISDEVYNSLQALKTHPRASFDEVIRTLMENLDANDFAEAALKRHELKKEVEIEEYFKRKEREADEYFERKEREAEEYFERKEREQEARRKNQ
jgi:predicted CopG family antitoxin